MKFLLEDILKPVSRRIGSVVAGMVATLNVLDPAALGQVETAVTVLVGLAIDLGLSAMDRKITGR